jgi:hypothetical protein
MQEQVSTNMPSTLNSAFSFPGFKRTAHAAASASRPPVRAMVFTIKASFPLS